MSITFCIEAQSEDEDEALTSEHTPTLTIGDTGGYILLAVLGIEPDHYGTIDAAELYDRIDTTRPLVAPPEHADTDYVVRQLDALREVSAAAHRLGRQVVWG